MMRLLIVTSVQAEAEAIGPIDDARLVVSGIGRTNAAAATTEAIIRDGPFGLVVCAGVGGVLPEGGLSIAETIVATSCVYFEEGVMTPSGFEDIAAMGFALATLRAMWCRWIRTRYPGWAIISAAARLRQSRRARGATKRRARLCSEQAPLPRRWKAQPWCMPRIDWASGRWSFERSATRRAIVRNKFGDWTTLWRRWARLFVRWPKYCAAIDVFPAGNQTTIRCIVRVEFDECYRSRGSGSGNWAESCVISLWFMGLEPQPI